MRKSTLTPVIYAHNKLIFNLSSESYKEEYQDTSLAFTKWVQGSRSDQKIGRVDVWLDILLVMFVFSSLFVARAVWVFGVQSYWITLGVVLLFMVIMALISYKKVLKNQKKLQEKRDKLAKIKGEYQSWHDETILKK